MWVNGSFVGYSQVSHSTSEFDVTELLREGENTLEMCIRDRCTSDAASGDSQRPF